MGVSVCLFGFLFFSFLHICLLAFLCFSFLSNCLFCFWLFVCLFFPLTFVFLCLFSDFSVCLFVCIYVFSSIFLLFLHICLLVFAYLLFVCLFADFYLFVCLFFLFVCLFLFIFHFACLFSEGKRNPSICINAHVSLYSICFLRNDVFLVFSLAQSQKKTSQCISQNTRGPTTTNKWQRVICSLGERLGRRKWRNATDLCMKTFGRLRIQVIGVRLDANVGRPKGFLSVLTR